MRRDVPRKASSVNCPISGLARRRTSPAVLIAGRRRWGPIQRAVNLSTGSALSLRSGWTPSPRISCDNYERCRPVPRLAVLCCAAFRCVLAWLAETLTACSLGRDDHAGRIQPCADHLDAGVAAVIYQ